MKQLELAHIYLRKAAEDEALLDAVVDIAAVPDPMIGFHCQQCLEKYLKARLEEAGLTVVRPINPGHYSIGHGSSPRRPKRADKQFPACLNLQPNGFSRIPASPTRVRVSWTRRTGTVLSRHCHGIATVLFAWVSLGSR